MKGKGRRLGCTSTPEVSVMSWNLMIRMNHVRESQWIVKTDIDVLT